MPRTSPGVVAKILGRNYIKGVDLSPYVDTASNVVDQVVLKAQAKGLTLTAPTLELIERWLSAHCYIQMDPMYESRSTADGSGSFEDTAKSDGFDGTRYGRMAQRLDWTNCLRNLDKVQQASCDWLGTDCNATPRG